MIKHFVALLFFQLLIGTQIITANPEQVDSLQQLYANCHEYNNCPSELLFDYTQALHQEGKYSEALPILTTIFQKSQYHSDNEAMLRSLQDMGYCYMKIGEGEKAVESYTRGLELSDSLNNQVQKASFYFGLGDYFRLKHDVPASIDYLEKAEAIYRALGMEEEICNKVKYTKASSYKISNLISDQWKGVAIYESMLTDQCLDKFSTWKISKIYNNLGSTYTFLKELEKANFYLSKALAIKRGLNKKFSLAYTLNEMASLRMKENNLTEALAFTEEAYEIVKTGEDIHLAYDLIETMGILHGRLGHLDKSMKLMNWHYKLRDSAQNMTRLKLITDLEAKYKSSEKDRAIAEQNLNLQIQKNKFRNLLLVGFILLTLATLFFFWFDSRLKRKNLEAETLEKLDHLKTRYFTNISHELRTPLSLILDPINQLKSQIVQPEQNHLLHTISNNANQMLHLVNQMMDLNKLEAGKMKLTAQKGDLGNTLQAITTAYQPWAQQANVQLSYSGTEETLTAYYDADKLEKIISNLLSNAIKFTPQSGAVSLHLEARNNTAEIIVRDSGVGIPQNKIPYIFNRFYQIDDSQTRAFAGTGIGLSLVKELVDLHQGTIEVLSENGKGTQMILQLPLGKAHLKPEQIVEQTISATNFKYQLPIQIVGSTQQSVTPQSKTGVLNGQEKYRVLIIEDNPELRAYIALQLSTDFQILEAENGIEGFEIAQQEIPDLIISDIMMPGMDGYALCAKIKESTTTAHIPVILLSAKSTQEEKILGLIQQADDYLTKPFDSRELSIRAGNLIEQRRKLHRLFTGAKTISPKAVTVNSVDEIFLQKILVAIEAQISNEKFGVEELSKAINLSRSQLHRKLIAITGKSSSAFLRSIRLKRAYQLLSQAHGNASEIAYQVGFSNSNYFFKCFKDEFAVTPGQVLKGEAATANKG